MTNKMQFKLIAINKRNFNYTFTMRDLDSLELITAIHCFTFEQAEAKFKEATKYA